jgi:uncharacterized protein (DUF433 family)
MQTKADRITKTADICGGDACIRGHRIPVWVLASYRQSGLSDSELLRSYPSLSLADFEAAWEYAANHPEEIADAIRVNEEGQEGFVE